tara:strand:- start:440 stop:631 length:192 start_codon:yes stop_codon:yes gene_type:complete
MNKMYDIVDRVCPTTILLNVSAIGIGMSEVEQGLKIISYAVAIVWTILKIRNEIKIYNEKRDK